MNNKTQSKKIELYNRERLTDFLVITLLLIVAAFLYINSEQRYKDFVSSQQSLMEKSTADTVQTLGVYIEQTRRIVSLFADTENDLILKLSSDPDDDLAHDKIRNRLKQSIPDYFSFTITDDFGMPLLDDFDGEIGDVCLSDIKTFAGTEHNSELVIHPNPLQYHFDIMSMLELADGDEGVFFVSFKPDVLAKLLAYSEIGSHKMMLLHQKFTHLIELTSQGSRDILQRDFSLSDEEFDSISVKHVVPGSFWTLVYLPDNTLFDSTRQHYRMQAMQEFAIVLFFCLVMLFLIKREEKKRHHAELALFESHQMLETRVQERTEILIVTNDKLQKEIEARIETEERLSVSERRYELAAKGAHDGIWEWDAATNKIYFSLRWLQMLDDESLGYDSTFVDWLYLIHEDDRGMAAIIFEQAQKGIIEEIDVEFRMYDKEGALRWYRCHAAAEKNSAGAVIRIAGSQADIQELKFAEQQLQHDAFHDALTGLPNRNVFMDRLGQAVKAQLRDKNYLYAVMFIDLDRFKTVNDSLGHGAGDVLLKGVTERLSDCIRPSDTLARLGGDEFVILVNGFKNVGDVTSLAERINEKVAEKFIIEDQELVVEASIGIALATENYTKPDQLLRDADIAMYRAKNTGAGKYFIYNESIRQDTMSRLKTETELRKSIQNDQLVIFYQPIVDLAQGSIYGFESLLRWQHPEKGLIQPDDFIPLAEETGLIVPIGAWVMEKSCYQIKQWQEQYPDYDMLSLSVNLSCKQFLQTDLTENIKKIISDTKIDKSTVSLNLEITETVVMQNASCSTDILQDLKMLGIRLAVDDFGTGYSSLAYLQRFPIDILKIDKQFVSAIDSDEDSRAIVNTVIDLATNLGLSVVAEGVETIEQFHILRDMGCKYGQGYYFSKPVPADKTEKLLVQCQKWS